MSYTLKYLVINVDNVSSLISWCIGSCSSNKLILPDDGVVMMIKVESCVENLILSIQNGSVPVSTLEILETYSTQFLKLGEIFQENKRRVGGDVKVNQIPIEKSFKQRTDELKLFQVQSKQFSYFTDICDVFDSSKCEG